MSLSRSSQRRHEDRNHIEPEVEVLAEPPRANFGRQILVRRSNDAHVDLHARGPAHRLDNLFLQGAQHLGLRLQAHVTYLVEEQRAAVRQLELAAAIGYGPGERPLHVAEQLALDQLLGNRGAVHLDERPLHPPAAHVNRSRHQLLAGAVFAMDENPAVGGRRHRDLLQQLAEHVALPHHRLAAIDRRAQLAVLDLEAALPDGVPDHQHGLLERQRLLDEIERPHLDRAHGRLDVAMAGDHDDRRVDPPLLQPGQCREAVHARQPDVEDDGVERRARRAIQAGFA
jgi:hypothetical protein